MIPKLQSVQPLFAAAALLLADAATALGETVVPDTVVSASREPLPAARVGSAASVITGAELETRQIRNAADALREVPGVAVGRTGSFGGVTDVRIRGAEAKHTLVLIDGMEVNDPALNSSFDFAQLAGYNVERIEVLRGPQSSIFGSDAVGGVVNIITRRARDGFDADGFVEGGSFSSFAGGAGLRFGNPWFRGSFAFDRLQTEGVSHAEKRLGNSERDALRRNTFGGKIDLLPAPYLEINLAGRLVESRGALDGFNFIPAIGFFGAVDDKSRYRYDQRHGKADVKLKLFEGSWVNRFGVSHGFTDNDFLDDAGQLANKNRSRRTKYELESTGRFETKALAKADHRLTFLFESERQDILSQGFDPFFPTFLKRGFSSRSYVGEYALGLLDRLFLTGSLRFDDNDFFKDATTWRVTLAYLMRETDTRFHASYGTGVKNPSLFELFGLFGAFVGNPNLKPERLTGWDVGVEQKFLGGTATVDVTYFNNRITDLIQSTLLTAFNVGGTSRAHGVEVAARWRILPDLVIGGAYTWSNSEDANDRELVRRAKHIGSVFATWSFDEKRAQIHVNARMNGPQRDLAFDPFFNTQRVRLAGYTLVNATASYRVHDNVEIFARAENLLDQRYQQVFTFGNPRFGAFAGVRVKLAATP
jgi:vitamin B12 transporter